MQALIGAWELSVHNCRVNMLKAIRDNKIERTGKKGNMLRLTQQDPPLASPQWRVHSIFHLTFKFPKFWKKISIRTRGIIFYKSTEIYSLCIENSHWSFLVRVLHVLYSQFPRFEILANLVCCFRIAYDSAYSLCTYEVDTAEPLWNTSYTISSRNISLHNLKTFHHISHVAINTLIVWRNLCFLKFKLLKQQVFTLLKHTFNLVFVS